MATVGFAIAASAGGAQAGSTALILATAAGSLLDSYVIFPAVFGQDNAFQGSRINDFPIQTASEGDPIPYVIGVESLTNASVLWASDVITEAVEQSAGGKGIGGTTAPGKRYYRHVLLQVAEGGARIDGIGQMWADGQEFAIEAEEGVSLSGTAFEIERIDPVYPPNNGDTILISHDDAANGGSLGDLRTGVDVTLTTFDDAVNNGTFTVLAVQKDFPVAGQSRALILNEDAVSAANPTAATATVVQTIPVSALADAVRFYKGLPTDDVDPLILAEEGAADSQSHVGIAKVMIEKLDITPFGGRIPTFKQTVKPVAGDSDTVPLAIQTLALRGNYDLTDIDVSRLDAAEEFRGATIYGPVQLGKQLEPLLVVHAIGVQKFGSKLSFFPLDADDLNIAVPESELGARPMDSSYRDVLSVTEVDEEVLPSKVTVNFTAVNREYQRGAESERRRNFPVVNELSIDANVAMTPSRARQLARRRLWASVNESREAVVSLGPNEVYTVGGDVVVTQVRGEDVLLRIGTATRGADFNIECSGNLLPHRDYGFFEEDLSDDDTDTDPVIPYVPPAVKVLLADIPALRDEDGDNPGMYWGAASTDPLAAWQSGSLYRSETSGGSLTNIATIPSEATIVRTLQSSTMPTVVNHNIPDLVSSVDVTFTNGAMTSSTAEEFLSNRNTIWWQNGEITTVKTVEDIGNGVYRLSYMMRGLRNTESRVGTHNAFEFGLLLDGAGIARRNTSLSDIGVTRYFRGAATGGDPTAAQEEALSFTGESMLPFSPVHPSGTRRDDGGIDASWVRRSRTPYSAFSIIEAPLGEDSEEYQVELMDPTGATVEQEYFALTTPSVTFTAAELTAAGYTDNGDAVKFNVYQYSATFKRGRVLAATV